MAKTPLRTFRINDDLYDRAKVIAEQHGITMTDVVVGALEMFIDETIDPALLKPSS